MDRIDELIQQRNAIQLRAEAIGESYAQKCWARLGVANRHIARVLDKSLWLSPAVEHEIETCFKTVAERMKIDQEEVHFE